MTRVFNLATQQEKFYSCIPRDAVIAAYAQDQKDWNTWDYYNRYDHLVEDGNYIFLLGDWGALKNPAEKG